MADVDNLAALLESLYPGEEAAVALAEEGLLSVEFDDLPAVNLEAYEDGSVAMQTQLLPLPAPEDSLAEFLAQLLEFNHPEYMPGAKRLAASDGDVYLVEPLSLEGMEADGFKVMLRDFALFAQETALELREFAAGLETDRFAAAAEPDDGLPPSHMTIPGNLWA